jgi:hypothetical protein
MIEEKKFKEALEKLGKEIAEIHTDLRVIGTLNNYQKRMLVQVFIDIQNHLDKFEKEVLE